GLAHGIVPGSGFRRFAPARRLLVRTEGRAGPALLEPRVHRVLRAGAGAVGRPSSGALELRASATDLIEVKVLFASASDPAVALAIARFRTIFPELPLVVVSEF